MQSFPPSPDLTYLQRRMPNCLCYSYHWVDAVDRVTDFINFPKDGGSLEKGLLWFTWEFSDIGISIVAVIWINVPLLSQNSEITRDLYSFQI